MTTKTTQMLPEDLLKAYFGYESFRPQQKEIIETILQGNDSLVLMPTGGGKSICYQIPALMLSGITLVVSPLISLMKDQVDSLTANGVEAAFLNSSLDYEEESEIIRRCTEGKIKLLYLAPERLISSFDFLSTNLNISLIAIDEAHCISGWGHDFRPEYTQLKILKEKKPEIPVVALTATADKVTRKDILSQLSIPNATVFIASFDRPNLSLEVRTNWKEKMKLNAILELIRSRPSDSGIIYCLSRKTTEEVSAFLNTQGVNSRFYHAGMPSQERAKVQEEFMNDTTTVIAATVAFGMGIDKSNIRWIVHYNIPKNIEGYYQEIGRAGRDGLDSDTYLYFNLQDLQTLIRFATESGLPDLNLEKLKRMQQFAEADVCRRKMLLNYFGENTASNCGNCDVCKNPPKHFDGTVLIQKALSALIRLNESVGSSMLIDVLRGSHKQEIIEKEYHLIKTFGIGSDISASDWKQYLMQMLNIGVLEMAYDEDFSLKVTGLGKEVLYGQRKMDMVLPKVFESAKSPQSVSEAAKPKPVTLEERLFDNLRIIRRKLAQAQNVPPYIVFSDVTLKALATSMPVTEDELLEISGISHNKKGLYGEVILAEICRFIHENQIIRQPSSFSPPKTPKTSGSLKRMDTFEVTLDLLRKGYKTAEISAERAISQKTILTHILFWYEKGEWNETEEFISPENIVLVAKAIEAVGDASRLKPIFEYLNEKIDYDTIRWGIAIWQKTNNLSSL